MVASVDASAATGRKVGMIHMTNAETNDKATTAYFNPAVQFKTTVMGAEADCSGRVGMRKRPSALMSKLAVGPVSGARRTKLSARRPQISIRFSLPPPSFFGRRR